MEGDWQPVTSSNLNRVRYNADTLEMDVEFKDKNRGTRTYTYYGVSRTVWQFIMRAPSKGTALDREVKKRGYTFKEW